MQEGAQPLGLPEELFSPLADRAVPPQIQSSSAVTNPANKKHKQASTSSASPAGTHKHAAALQNNQRLLIDIRCHGNLSGNSKTANLGRFFFYIHINEPFFYMKNELPYSVVILS